MTISEAIRHLLGGYPAMQQLGIRFLISAGKPAIPILLNQLETSSDSEAIGRTAWALEEILNRPENRDEGTLLTLIGIADTDNYDRSANAVKCILKFEDHPKARTALAHLARNARDASVRQVALGSFVSHIRRDPSEVPFVKSFLNDSSENVQIYAAGLLGSMGDKSGIPLVLKVLRNSDVNRKTLRLQSLAAKAAGKIGDASLIPSLEALTNDRRRPITADTAQATARIRLTNLQTEGERLAFLKAKFLERGFEYWAGLQLSLMGTPGAESLLQTIAEEDGHPGRAEARRHYEVYLQKKKEAQK